MTLHVVDVSRWQVERPDPLNLEDARNVGFGAVNIALDRGREEDVLPPWAAQYASRARALGMGMSCYRWLDGRIPGAESARRAFERMHLLGGPDGMAHAVDCEADATERILREYVTTMTGLLGRPIAVYSGRWWLQPRGWQVADLSPFLWAAPGVGYLPEYPGDDSPHWVAGYGGYQNLALMQYAVQPLPGTGKCSLSAVRDPLVWNTLTGGVMPAAEYPDTTWAGFPRAYGTGRDGKAVRLSVIHYTAGSESRTSAENGAAYDKTRTDGTSCHVFHDPDSSVQEVLRKDRSNSAFSKGNRLGIHHELCGTAQTRAQWLDPASDAILWRAARAVAKDCRDFGLEPRRLSVAEVRASWYSFPNGPRGICGHVDITRAFPEDGGTHTDPGDGFPWDVFLARVNESLTGQDDDMKADERNWLENVYQGLFFGGPSMGAAVDDKVNDGSGNALVDVLQHTRARIDAMAADLAAIKAAPLTVTDAQVAQLAAALVADVDTPLGPEDSPVIEAAVKKALRDLVQPS